MSHAEARANPTHPAHPIWSRALAWTLVGAVLAGLAAAGLKSYRDLTASRQREAQLDIQIVKREESIEVLRHKIERLGKDPVMLERVAREELGLVKPADVVIVLPERAHEPEKR